MDDIFISFAKKHPGFGVWAMGLTNDPITLAFQFAVIDRWRPERDVDVLYARLHDEAELYAALNGVQRMPMPQRDEFAETVKLYLPMIFNVPWRRIRNLPLPKDPGVEQVRIKRSR